MKLSNGQDILVSVELLHHSQYVAAYVMCDEIGKKILPLALIDFSNIALCKAGTVRSAELKFDFPASIFPEPATISQAKLDQTTFTKTKANAIGCSNVSQEAKGMRNRSEDEFSDADLNDNELMEAGKFNRDMTQTLKVDFSAVNVTEFNDIDSYTGNLQQNITKSNSGPKRALLVDCDETKWHPKQLDNGKWACNHKCKDKTA